MLIWKELTCVTWRSMARRIFQFGRNRCVWKSADDVVADGQRRLPIWKEIAYLIQGSAGDIVTDGDSVGRWNDQICSDSDKVLV